MSSKTPAPKTQSRDQRLKSALKANMARRKAQARARDAAKPGQTGEKTEKDA